MTRRDPPPSHPSELPRLLTESVTPITTETLARKGIPGVRVLSESRFLHLVRRLVESSIQRRLDARAENPPASPGPASPGSADSDDDAVFVLDDDRGYLHAAEERQDEPLPRPENAPRSETGEVETGAGAAPTGSPEGAPSTSSREGLRGEYQARWDRLRQGQLDALSSIEQRLEKLGNVFQAMEKNLSVIQAPADSGGEPETEPGTRNGTGEVGPEESGQGV